MQHLWFDKNIKEAIDAERLHHQLLPMQVIYDIGFDQVKGTFEVQWKY